MNGTSYTPAKMFLLPTVPAATSVGNQNPSLTFMALTARAANHAIEELKKEYLTGFKICRTKSCFHR
jgi:hypothetical protein